MPCLITAAQRSYFSWVLSGTQFSERKFDPNHPFQQTMFQTTYNQVIPCPTTEHVWPSSRSPLLLRKWHLRAAISRNNPLYFQSFASLLVCPEKKKRSTWASSALSPGPGPNFQTQCRCRISSCMNFSVSIRRTHPMAAAEKSYSKHVLFIRTRILEWIFLCPFSGTISQTACNQAIHTLSLNVFGCRFFFLGSGKRYLRAPISSNSPCNFNLLPRCLFCLAGGLMKRTNEHCGYL